VNTPTTAPQVLVFDQARRTNADLIADAARIGWLPEPVFDATYGKGAFWSKYKPETLVTNDLYKPADHAFDYGQAFPTDMHRQYGCVVYDPDYKLQGSGSKQFAAKNYAYGVDRDKTVGRRLGDLRTGAVNSGALVRKGGFLLIKCQDQVACGKVHRQTGMVAEELKALPGWTMLLVDWFDASPEWRFESWLHLTHTAPPQRSQVKPRNNYSTLLAFRRRR
jgi:hypothetical protein